MKQVAESSTDIWPSISKQLYSGKNASHASQQPGIVQTPWLALQGATQTAATIAMWIMQQSGLGLVAVIKLL
jgi:hypothetical protein